MCMTNENDMSECPIEEINLLTTAISFAEDACKTEI